MTLRLTKTLARVLKTLARVLKTLARNGYYTITLAMGVPKTLARVFKTLARDFKTLARVFKTLARSPKTLARVFVEAESREVSKGWGDLRLVSSVMYRTVSLKDKYCFIRFHVSVNKNHLSF